MTTTMLRARMAIGAVAASASAQESPRRFGTDPRAATTRPRRAADTRAGCEAWGSMPRHGGDRRSLSGHFTKSGYDETCFEGVPFQSHCGTIWRDHRQGVDRLPPARHGGRVSKLERGCTLRAAAAGQERLTGKSRRLCEH